VNRAAVTARDLARALDLALGAVLDRDDVPDRPAGGDLDLTAISPLTSPGIVTSLKISPAVWIATLLGP
jgi:hypothetical protein